MTTKRCPKCAETKPLGEFYRNRTATDGRQPYCIPCWSSYYKKKRESERTAALDALPSDLRFREFSDLVRSERARRSLTQAQLGTLVGVGASQVRLWEKAKALPQRSKLVAVCSVLGIEIPLSARAGDGGRLPICVRDCTVCGKLFPVYKLGVARCSRSCGTAARNKARAMLIGAVVRAGHGYVKVRTMSGWRLQHRAVMEQTLGRALEPHERVHHKNGNRADNRPENLELWKVKTKDPPGVRAADYHCPGCHCSPQPS